MYLKTTTLCLLLSLWAVGAASQIKLSGKAIDANTHEGVSFATVVLRSVRDTAQVKFTITDFNGGYIFEAMKPGGYWLEFSCLGYVPLQKRIRLAIPSAGGDLERTDTLQVDVQQIDEVRVTANHQRTANRQAYSFTAQEVKQSANAHALIQNLSVIEENPMSGKLQGVRGESVLMLINGIAATENEVRMLPPAKVKRVEVYDVPPARYREAGMVIDIITGQLETGVAAGFSLRHAFTTGFADDNAYLSIVSGRHKFSADYALSYRDYDDRRYEQFYRYSINDTLRNLDYSNKDQFGYTYHLPSMKYSYINTDKHIFELKLGPTMLTNFSEMGGTGIYTVGEQEEAFDVQQRNNERSLMPSGDVYYWRKLSEVDDISGNVVLTLFDTKRNLTSQELRQADGHAIFCDTLDLHNNKISLIGEVAYSHQFGANKLKLSNIKSGYRAQQSWLHSYYSNAFGHTDYRSLHLQQYAYVELNGNSGALHYQASAGLSHIRTSSIYDKHDDLIFTPRMVFAYSKGVHFFRASYSYTPTAPDINNLSSNASYVSRDIIKVGNPYLIYSHSHLFWIRYQLRTKFADLTFMPFQIIYEKNPIVEYFEMGDHKKYEQCVVNGDLKMTTEAWVVASIRPFGTNIITLWGYIGPEYQKTRYNSSEFTNLEFPCAMSITFRYKDLFMRYSYTIPTLYAHGVYRHSRENTNMLNASYTLKNWTFSAGCFFIGGAARYWSETLEGSPIYFTSDTRIYNNKNMVTLGVSYHFGKGKDWQYTRQLDNRDEVAPSK